MSTISLMASSLRSDLYGRYIIDRESPYTANEKARLLPRAACWATAVRGSKTGSSAKVESRTRRLIPKAGSIGFMFVSNANCERSLDRRDPRKLTLCAPFEDSYLMILVGQTRSFGDVRSMSTL